VVLDDWQSYVIDSLFAVNEANEWAATEFGALVARQNGKGEILVAYDLAHLFLFPRLDRRRKSILHTAHEFKTAMDGFDRLRGVIESVPRLSDRVEQIYKGNTAEILLKRAPGQKTLGNRIKFVARSKNSGRGFSADIIVYDEAQELSVPARNALTYTQSAVPNRQELYTGTVPEDGLNESEVFEGVRDRGRSSEPNRTGWAEWSPEGSEDPDLAALIDLGSDKVWADSNPAKDIRIRTETIAEQHERDKSPNKQDFARERCSIWPARRPEEEVIHNEVDLKVWGDSADSLASLGPSPVLAVSLGRGGGYATISAASRAGERIFVETKDTRLQTLWVPGALKALVDALKPALVVLDEKNCAPILTDLTMAGIKYLPVNAGEVAGAFGLMVESVNAGQVLHRGQDDLLQSLKNATTRPLVGGETWDQTDPAEPITQIQSVTLAHWGVKKNEANPAKEEAIITGIR
jgi:phage terminase large subunit-like protein